MNVIVGLASMACVIPPKDFGDYADSYYSVQTIEGERIAQLIAGYIDIILKKVSSSKSYLIVGPYNSEVEHSINQILFIACFPLPRVGLFESSISKSAFPFRAIE